MLFSRNLAVLALLQVILMEYGVFRSFTEFLMFCSNFSLLELGNSTKYCLFKWTFRACNKTFESPEYRYINKRQFWGLSHLFIIFYDLFIFTIQLTPLHNACLNNHLDTVKVLLNDSRTDPNAVDIEGVKKKDHFRFLNKIFTSIVVDTLAQCLC